MAACWMSVSLTIRLPRGVRLEGAGIKPDTVSPIIRADIYSRHDRALELAMNLLD